MAKKKARRLPETQVRLKAILDEVRLLRMELSDLREEVRSIITWVGVRK